MRINQKFLVTNSWKNKENDAELISFNLSVDEDKSEIFGNKFMKIENESLGCKND
jgi:hypothetical protein